MSPLHLRGQTPESLAQAFPGLGLPLARRIVRRLIGEDADDLEGVRGLGRERAREVLAGGSLSRLEVVDRRRSRVDPFVKYLLRTADGRLVETVRIPLEKPRWSACVSSQVGCALGCRFCQTGRLGFTRNLEAWEMVEQALIVRRESPERPLTGVVFQGQGEPFLNYENVVQAAAVLRQPSGPRVGSDRITISTVGLVPRIRQYTDEGHPYRLMLSLTSAFSEKRARLLPVTARQGVPELAAAMRRHASVRGGPVSLAWVLIAGFNTGEDEARELGRLFRGVPLRVSIIDVDDPTGAHRRASDEERRQFLSALSYEGIAFVRRYSGGADIHAACGMLAARAEGGEAHAPDLPVTA